jgi:mRNA interferase MazF
LERGDVLELRAPRGARGHEQSGSRYAIVLQAGEFWPASTVVVVPTSRSAPPRRFRPLVTIRAGKTTVLVDQIAAFDVSRFGEHVESVSEASLAEIDQAVIRFLGLSGRFRSGRRVRS